MVPRLPALLLLASAAVAASQEYCPEGGQCDMDTEESVQSDLNLLQVGLNLKQKKDEVLQGGEDILKDLYMKKAPRTYPLPSGNELKCHSRHHRNDPQPSRAAAGMRVPSNVRNVESELLGKGLWKRYDGNRGKPWRHAKVDSNWAAKGLVEMARDGRKPNDGMAHTPMATSYKNQLSTAVNSIKSECNSIGNCFHDNYISIPVGEANSHVFSPGLNQLWVILDPGRHDVLATVVVGAAADDTAVAYYISKGNNAGFVSQMSFDFTTFSEATNPITFTINLSTSNGLAALTMDIKHTGGNHYVNVHLSCNYGGISGWKDRWSVTMWGWKHVKYEFDLFVEKGTQIYDICHCYHSSNYALMACTTASGGSSIWESAIADIVKWVRDAFLSRSSIWVKVPTITYTNGGKADCWSHYNSMLTSSDIQASQSTATKLQNQDDVAAGSNANVKGECSVMSIIMGAGSTNGEFCQEGCFDPASRFATEGHTHIDTMKDEDCASRGFGEYHHSVKAEFTGRGEETIAENSAQDDDSCNMHFISEGDFCENFCLGHGVTDQDGVEEEDGKRMEDHGMVLGKCSDAYSQGLGWHTLKVYGPEGQA